MDTENAEDDAQMREMMGFTHFGMQKPDPAMIPPSIPPSDAPAGKKAKLSEDNDNLPAKPDFEQWRTNMLTRVPTNSGSTAAISNNSSEPSHSQTAYKNPTTGISFTRQELYEYGHGRKTNAKGDVVFFKPSFVENNPWRALSNNKQS